jgi:hypothetical protein
LIAQSKRLVLNANSLIRASLGVRVRVLIADFVNEVHFDVAEANAAEAAGYLGELATRRGLDPQIWRWARGLWRSPYSNSADTPTSAMSSCGASGEMAKAWPGHLKD